MTGRFRFRSQLWRHSGEAAWYFVTLPTDVADEIDDLTGPARRGFGSVRVVVTVGATTWNTSVFPDTAAESFVLPIKKQVRVKEGIDAGEEIEVTLELT